jgi:putative transposase
MDSDSSKGYASLRRGRASLDGQVYLITFVTWKRRPWFADPARANTAAQCMAESRATGGSRLLAWVLMPDHWHGLIELGCGENLSNVVRRLKGTSARAVRKQHRWPHRIWADGFHDRALRSEDDLPGAARYLVLNPFRAGLVRRIGDYPYWGAVWVDRRQTDASTRAKSVGAEAPPTDSR